MRHVFIVTGFILLGSLYADKAQIPLDGQNLDHMVIAQAPVQKPRLHPTRHFESFADVKFEEKLDGSAAQIVQRQRGPAEVGRHRAGYAIADAASELNNQVDVDGAKVHTKPVSNKEYHAFIQAAKHPVPSHWKNGVYDQGADDKPITNVSYHDAQSYAKWANKRLPSHNEWMSAADQMSWDLEMPKNEWTSSISGTNVDGTQQVILNQNGSLSTMNPLDASLDTGFRVVTPSSWELPKPQGDAFITPEGDTILPDESRETPGGDIITPSGNPYDYGQ